MIPVRITLLAWSWNAVSCLSIEENGTDIVVILSIDFPHTMKTKYALGNLASYRVHVVPMAKKAYGQTEIPKHRQNIHDIIHALFVGGTCTTWEMAKQKYDDTVIRSHDRMYRRLLMGRTDRDVHSKGILEMGLIIVDENPPKTKRYKQYRLSLYGILYCLYVLDPPRKDIEKMVTKYEFLLPEIFGRWKSLKSVLRADAYNLRILARGITMENITDEEDNPVYGLLSYMRVKYRRNFDFMYEKDLAEQISYWFYTFLLYNDDGTKLRKILDTDKSLKRWYAKFFEEARNHYAKRLHTISKVRL